MLAVLICAVLTVQTNAATVTVNGLRAFDQSLGVLTSATVSIDVTEREVPAFAVFPARPIPDHQHSVALRPIQIGLREIEFPSVPTSVNSTTLGTHSHLFDPPVVSEMFTGGDLSYFLPAGPFLYPFGFFKKFDATTEAEGHTHGGGPLDQFYISGNEIQITFEYVPVPEPTACLTLGVAISVIQFFARSRRS